MKAHSTFPENEPVNGLAPGQIKKILGVVGMITDVCISPTTGQIVIFFYGPRHAFKGQTLGDMIPMSSAEVNQKVQEATQDDLNREYENYKRMVNQAIDQNLGDALHGSLQ